MRLRSLAKPILIAAAAGLMFAVAGAFAFVRSGMYDVAASNPPSKLAEWLTHETMIHSVRRHAASIPPTSFSARQVAAGFCRYEAHCVACHGAAAVARQQWVSGMEPAPPYLLDVQQRFTQPQLFWIVKNGIKMTGMPAWKNEMSDSEVWEVVAWLEASAKLPPQTYVQWRKGRRCGA